MARVNMVFEQAFDLENPMPVLLYRKAKISAFLPGKFLHFWARSNGRSVKIGKAMIVKMIQLDDYKGSRQLGI